jgi:hypothetical protein
LAWLARLVVRRMQARRPPQGTQAAVEAPPPASGS